MLIFVGLLALVVIAYYWTRVSRTALFWAAFVLTRPLGAVVGDFLDKPVHAGGLAGMYRHLPVVEWHYEAISPDGVALG